MMGQSHERNRKRKYDPFGPMYVPRAEIVIGPHSCPLHSKHGRWDAPCVCMGGAGWVSGDSLIRWRGLKEAGGGEGGGRGEGASLVGRHFWSWRSQLEKIRGSDLPIAGENGFSNAFVVGCSFFSSSDTVTVCGLGGIANTDRRVRLVRVFRLAPPVSTDGRLHSSNFLRASGNVRHGTTRNVCRVLTSLRRTAGHCTRLWTRLSRGDRARPRSAGRSRSTSPRRTAALGAKPRCYLSPPPPNTDR